MNRKNNDVVMDIKEMLERAKPPVTAECCIYKVPFHRKLDQDAYTPKCVSIGPFHHGNDRLQNMERHKIMYCKSFLERTNTRLESWTGYIEREEQREEPKFRRCYSDVLEFTQQELVKIIFVDAGFILELFSRYFRGRWSSDDTCLSSPWLADNIRLDLLLLENQLPFFVLQDLFSLSLTSMPNGDGNNNPSLIDMAFDYFAYYNKSGLTSHGISIRHFTDLVRTFLLRPFTERHSSRTTEGELLTYLPTVTELSEAGVRFKVNTESKSLLDLRFSSPVLEIPQLDVEDSHTEPLFRNMIALEQFQYPDESYITDYVIVLDFLVNTSKDVDILVGKGILVNYLGDSDSVANMINGLCKGMLQVNFTSHYLDLGQDLNGFYRNPLQNLKVTLRRDYCKGPWQTAATIAAIVLLILSFVQAVSSVWQIMKQ